MLFKIWDCASGVLIVEFVAPGCVEASVSELGDKCVDFRRLCLLCLKGRVNQSCVTVLIATSVEDALWTLYDEVLSSLLFDAKGLQLFAATVS